MSAHEKATPRPWQVSSGSGRGYAVRGDNKPLAEVWLNGDDPLANATLIVEAVNSFDTLTAERDALKAENERLQDEQSTVDHWSMGYRAGWEDCEAGKWKHISKAPKDGTHIIVPIGRGLSNVVSWFDGAWRETTNALRLTNEPTHWLPLPKPPVTP